MRKVLHLGPCNSRGGMATVMHTLAEHPPTGWQADLLSSHAEGGVWSKWRAYRRARHELLRRFADEGLRPDVVHVHVAADWSWRRKVRFITLARAHGLPVVVHLHSGQFDTWLSRGGEKRQHRVRSVLDDAGVHGVVLSLAWHEKLTPVLGPLEVVHNPHPPLPSSTNEREQQHLLLLGRSVPAKGHDFAVALVTALRSSFPDVRLTMTGASKSAHTWVDARGWVSVEEKASLLAEASVLLVPSAFEGQPVVVLEALAAGLPVCTSDRVKGLPETVETARFGDVEAWVEAVSNLFENPPTPASLKASVASYGVDKIQQRWKSLYESL